ncbi:MAG: hypothetical protein JRE45_06935 [Deltaproteobacteria bacterium]|nr:hypothetical protein [Deltaproteobacteria bacterium]MBW2627340.1 hypothetical protein [Deltaproteobacteria bacterium]
MAGTLVEQLVDAGLVTEAQAQASDAGQPGLSSGQVVQNLVAAGLDERALAGFFVSLGFGPMLQSQELARADGNLVRRLPGVDAHDLCAMPLRPSPAGAIVAMADPTDQRAVARLSEALGGSILPTVAKLSDLLASIDRAYPPERPAFVTDPLALGRSRPSSGVVPLVQAKHEIGTDRTLSALDPSLSDLASTASPVWDRAWKRSTTEREVSLTPESSHVPLPIVSRPPTARPSPVHPATVQPPRMSDSAIDAHLAELGHATSRDDVVRIACRACLAAARGAAFLALRKGVFRGWDGAGEDVTSAGIRSLWVPASNPSILNEVLHSGRVFQGAYGQTAADHLFRAAFGSQGRDVVIVPVMIGSRMVGVLCANDPWGDTSAIERVAEAVGHAFERLIVSKKSGG